MELTRARRLIKRYETRLKGNYISMTLSYLCLLRLKNFLSMKNVCLV